MEEHKDINNRLDELFAKARTGKPVMGVDEVRNLIATAPIAATPKSDKSARSNSSLYMLLGGIAIVAITIGIWFYLENDKQQIADVAQVAATTTGAEQNTDNGTAIENNQQPAQENVTNAAETQTDETANENHEPASTVADNAKKETGTKTESTPAEKLTPAEVPAPEASRNKTYLVTGGDFVVNFETDDKKVKMKLNDDDVKELSINGKAIASSDYPKYKDLIEKGKKMMDTEKSKNPSTAANTKTPEEQKRDEINTRLFTAFTDQLKKDKLINEDKYSFKLTSSELLIDGKPQPDAIRQKYIDLFKSTAGRDLGGATFKFDHGMN